MEPEQRCPPRGQMISRGNGECPLCPKRRGHYWPLRSDAFSAAGFASLIPRFVIAGSAAGLYREVGGGLREKWYGQLRVARHREGAWR
jgi:hypothetical protein